MRVVTMLMIIGLHYFLFGGPLFHAKGLNQKLAWFIEAFFFVAVNCYVLISGYFLVTKKNFHMKKIASLWLQVVFYTTIFYSMHLYFHPSFHWKDFFHVILPVRYEAYWFVTAYFGLYFISPFLAHFARSMTKQQYVKFLIISTSLFGFYSFFRPESDPFKMHGGYSTLWFIVLFFWGGYIRLWDLSMPKEKALLIYSASCVFTFLSSWPVHWLLKMEGFKVGKFGLNGFYNYNSPSVWMASLALFFVFYKIEIGNRWLRKLVLWMGPLTFGVYLIHMNQHVAQELWGHWIHVSHAYTGNALSFLGHMMVTVLGIFIVCLLIDWMRLKLFQLLAPWGNNMWKSFADKLKLLRGRLSC
ncbi:acyltransferase [uncultured Dialister sp.]|uniref:acyltransferase n=1 Tax=uncultured Dialister sp. TaxID=278064 RepID=UPI002594713B|nr:acyltransferase [uncultured Dialister sp.]